MALQAGKVPELPDLACFGLITKVGDSYTSQKGVYQVIPLEIKGKSAGRDGVFFFVYEPRWFGASFDPDELKSELQDGRPVKFGMYRRTINDEAKPSVLVSLLHEDFEAFGAELTEEEPDPKDITQLLRKYLAGRDVLYLMKQRKDEDGKLSDQYNIQSFYAPTEENIEYLIEQANNERRKTPLVVTWDE